MKNQPLSQRLGFAWSGLTETFRSESSFKVHVAAAIAALLTLLWLRPAPLWWAVVALTVALVLGAELVNTAIEALADHLHPDQHPRIRVVKDCAAAAVLIVSLGAIAVALALLLSLRQ